MDDFEDGLSLERQVAEPPFDSFEGWVKDKFDMLSHDLLITYYNSYIIIMKITNNEVDMSPCSDDTLSG